MKAENLRQEFATRAVNLREAFTDNSLSSFVEGASKELEAKQVILDAMFKLFDERGPGSSLIYKNKHRQYGFVLPDASQEGAFRYQLFDAKGFFSHSTFDSADEAVVELCDNGYCELAPDDTLDKLSQTRDWKFGTEHLAVRTAVASGQITWQQGEREYARLAEKYDPDLWVA
jgi:hypothetical protein